MKIKRFTAPDIRQAIAKVRAELGSDAVILSNRQIEGGVEIVSAIDYDDSIFENPEIAADAVKPYQGSNSLPASVIEPQARHDKRVVTPPNLASSRQWAEEYLRSLQQSKMSEISSSSKARNASKSEPVSSKGVEPAVADDGQAEKGHSGLAEMQQELQSLRSLLEHQLSSLAWGDLARRFPRRAKLLRVLLELGLAPALSRKIASQVEEDADFERIWHKALSMLAAEIPVVANETIDQGGIIALVGPTGVGKTTTVAKLAARYALRHGAKKIALITTDTYRIGAQEQLRTYGRILGIPVRVIHDATQLRNTLNGLYDKQLVLIDTAGMSQRDLRLTEQFSLLSEGAPKINTYLVLSANTQRVVLEDAVRAFKGMSLAGCIVTKLDESMRLGGVLSVVIQNRLPIAYVSDGQRVPEDLGQARAVALVNRSVAMLRQSEYRLENEEIEMAFGGLAAHDHS